MANRVHLGLGGGWAFNKAELLSPGPGLKSNYAATNLLTRTCTQKKKIEKRMLCHQSLTAFYKPSSRSQKKCNSLFPRGLDLFPVPISSPNQSDFWPHNLLFCHKRKLIGFGQNYFVLRSEKLKTAKMKAIRLTYFWSEDKKNSEPGFEPRSTEPDPLFPSSDLIQANYSS